MKKPPCRITVRAVLVLCIGLAGTHSLLAGDSVSATSTQTNSTAAAQASTSTVTDSSVSTAPATEPTDYKNWINVGTGGLIQHGDTALLKQQQGISGDVFGGIEDMHIEQDIDKTSQFIIDGRALFDTRDYKLELQYIRQDIGYIKMGYTHYRTWEDDKGGFLPLSGRTFGDAHDGEMALDRGEIWVELGLRMPDVPEITLRYSHQTRNGQEDSTIWGTTTFSGGVGTRSVVPAFRDINESRDTFTGDASKTFGNTDVSAGMIYEFINNRDTLYLENSPGAANNIFITQKENFQSDMYSGHGSTVTRFNDNFWLTTGYSYTTFGGLTGGSRIYGPSYNSTFNPLGTAALGYGTGYIDLDGESAMKQHVANFNVLWTPMENLTITPEFRVEHDDTEATSTFIRTTAAPQPAVPSINVASHDELLTVDEGIEARYTGVPDWVFYARGDLEQQQEHRQDNGSISYTAGGLNLDADTSVRSEKITVGTNWYPLQHLNFSTQYYHQREDSNYDYLADDFSQANQRASSLNNNVDDVNFRATWKPLPNLSLVSRYDFQYATIYSRWKALNAYYEYGLSSREVNHIFSESITWNPFAQMYIQGTGSYVFNRTHTPASENVALNPIQDSKNDYWTLGASTGLSLDEKTSLKMDGTYYRASDYTNDSSIGMPYGDNAQEYTASISLTRQVSETVRVTLQYSYYNFMDDTYGDSTNYEGHLIYASTQIRF